jgi:hypothetical protein
MLAQHGLGVTIWKTQVSIFLLEKRQSKSEKFPAADDATGFIAQLNHLG